ncbi:RNA-binding protein [archaeon]|nr:RNA-binding protein [archaeon]MBT3577588.1 RNA-binding protein [archaeon]MBT6820136.1 RNA-binding protein [archaeon]MBT6956212.1 RNA-binding protein [archaeon]MBT7025706.1 RNA-binding protein [archaeon]
MKECTSCGKETQGSIKFPCPKCKNDIQRCNKCRSLSIEYKCDCGHKGP